MDAVAGCPARSVWHSYTPWIESFVALIADMIMSPVPPGQSA